MDTATIVRRKHLGLADKGGEFAPTLHDQAKPVDAGVPPDSQGTLNDPYAAIATSQAVGKLRAFHRPGTRIEITPEGVFDEDSCCGYAPPGGLPVEGRYNLDDKQRRALSVQASQGCGLDVEPAPRRWDDGAPTPFQWAATHPEAFTPIDNNLADAVSQAALCADTSGNPALPQFAEINISIDNKADTITVTSTDRYMAARTVTANTVGLPPGEWQMSGQAAAKLCGKHAGVAITPGGDLVLRDSTGRIVVNNRGNNLLPNMKSLFKPCGKAAPMPAGALRKAAGMNATYLQNGVMVHVGVLDLGERGKFVVKTSMLNAVAAIGMDYPDGSVKGRSDVKVAPGANTDKMLMFSWEGGQMLVMPVRIDTDKLTVVSD